MNDKSTYQVLVDANIRRCMDALNGITLSDREWKAFLNEYPSLAFSTTVP